MKIAFPVGTLSYRGTHVAIHDYAHFNQEILGNKSIICIDAEKPGPSDLLKKFEQQFHCIFTNGWSDLSKQALQAQCDAVYILKSGERDGQMTLDLPTLIHAVFPQPIAESHGSVYAFVSEWLSQECSNGRIPYVPHMINLPKVEGDLREELGIPADATVFGCYGGMDSFDLDFVQRTLRHVSQTHRRIWFIFMNIRPFGQHERLIFLDASTDPARKTRFIQTCDAMLHARSMGESFGLSCGEFSVCNKPVLTYGLSPQRAHLHMLSDKALIYRGPEELKALLTDFDRRWAMQQSWDMYSQKYSPEPVMRRFAQVFLSPELKLSQLTAPAMSLKDRMAVEWAHMKRRFRSHSRKYHHLYS